MRDELLCLLLLLLAAPSAHAARMGCMVSATSRFVDHAMVRPPVGEPFEVALNDDHVDVALNHASFDASLTGRVAQLEVRGELSFSASTAELPLAVSPGSQSLAAQVKLGTAPWTIAHAFAAADHAIGELTAGDTMVTNAAFRCDRLLVLDDSSLRRSAMQADDSRFVSHVDLRSFVLDREPDLHGGVTVRSLHGLDAVELERKGRRIRVAVALDGFGATAEGWIDARRLRPGRLASRGSLGYIVGGGGGGTGCSPSGRTSYFGPAVIATGTPVYDRERKSVWAHATPHHSWVVYSDPESDWVGIGDLPGVHFGPSNSTRTIACGDAHAWVHRSDAHLGVSRKNGLTIERAWPTPAGDAPVLVMQVEPGSRWAKLGLRAGDRIARADVNGGSLSADLWQEANIGDLRSVLGYGGMSVVVQRGGERLTIALPDTCPSRHEGNGFYSGTPRECVEW